MDKSNWRFVLVLGGLCLGGVLVWWILHFSKREVADPHSSYDYSMAIEAYKKKDYTKALQYFQKAVQMGDAAGYYGLGHMYQQGQGTPINYEKSIQNYQNYVRALAHFQRACDVGVETSCAAAKRLRDIGRRLEKLDPDWPWPKSR
ncbi:SEL1-like repeat protein [Helicobacter sp. L8]|uniref:tetratricopeptide repeat protein n=1 Tax=Helicobacter sp. L8 TaxID=2316078 RepID=UPI000EB015C6|nr:SEL1-like repeat protein [Helicobacter sp. L8]